MSITTTELFTSLTMRLVCKNLDSLLVISKRVVLSRVASSGCGRWGGGEERERERHSNMTFRFSDETKRRERGGRDTVKHCRQAFTSTARKQVFGCVVLFRLKLTSMVPDPSRSKASNTSRALARRRFSGDAPRIKILVRIAAALVRLVSWASSAFPASVCAYSIS